MSIKIRYGELSIKKRRRSTMTWKGLSQRHRDKRRTGVADDRPLAAEPRRSATARPSTAVASKGKGTLAELIAKLKRQGVLRAAV